MNDLALVTLLRSTVLTGLAAQSLGDVIVAPDYQPVQQGAASERAVYMHKLFDKRHGFQGKKDVWDAGLGKMVHTETSIIETTFQFSARVTVDPNSETMLTASDVLNIVALILQSDVALTTLKAQNVQMYRITDVRDPLLVNDYERNDFAPSFDFVVTHKRSLESETPVLQSFEFDIHRV